MVGGAISKDQRDYFKVGQKNLQVIKRILDDYGLEYKDQETLGHYSRTVRVDVDTGDIVIKKIRCSCKGCENICLKTIF